MSAWAYALVWLASWAYTAPSRGARTLRPWLARGQVQAQLLQNGVEKGAGETVMDGQKDETKKSPGGTPCREQAGMASMVIAFSARNNCFILQGC